jgi:predicted nucleic acid-binding protein
MPMVVDASVTISWYLADEATDTAQSVLERLRESEAIVPALWWFETRNVLLMNERRGRLDQSQTTAILAHLARLPIALDREPAGDAALALARAHRLTFYDAAYLELALRRDVPLATLDRRLAAAARTAAVRLLGEDA